MKNDGVFDKISAKMGEKLTNFNAEHFLSFIFKRDSGFVVTQEENGFNYAIIIDASLLARSASFRDINFYFKKCIPHAQAEQIYNNIIKEVVNVVPNTFIFLTNIEFDNWFNGQSIVQEMLNSYPCYNLVTISTLDIDEEKLQASNDSREFSFSSNVKVDKDSWYYNYITKHQVSDNYYTYTIARYPDLLEVYDDYRNKTIPMILPLNNPLEEKAEYAGKGISITLDGFEAKDKTYFNSKLGAKAQGLLYPEVDFFSFYDAEISLNLFSVFEGVRVYNIDGQTYQSLFFYSYEDDQDINTFDVSDLNDNTQDKIYEDKMISDIYTVVPIRYECIDTLRKLRAKDNNFVVNNIITGLAFQDNYEFGNNSGNIVNNAERMERIDLGSFNIMLTEEAHYNYYKKTPICILDEEPLQIRLVASVDKETHTGVLYLLNLGLKVKPTKYLDEVTRNGLALKVDEKDDTFKDIRIKIADDGTKIANLYAYLEQKFDIKRVGTPRNLILSPFLSDYNDSENASIAETCKHLKASLLYGEAMFEDGEELGKIVDKTLDNDFKDKFGSSVYDYNTMNISKVSILQYSDTYKDYLAERIDFAVVNLFYLELVQLEESAIQVANMSISNFVNNYKLDDKSIKTNKRNTSSKLVLDQLEGIQEEYTKTLDFWESQTNYYSSNIIMSTIRKKFDIEKDVARLKRNHKEIQQIYDNRQQNASNRTGIIISIVGIILTVLNVLDIYTAAADKPEEAQYLSNFERFIFENISTINVIRILLVIVFAYYLIKFLVKTYISKKTGIG